MSDDSADVAALHAGDPQRRWPTLVCDGWITPNHPRLVIRASAPEAGISFGMCPNCAASMSAAAERARGRRWRESASGQGPVSHVPGANT